MYFSWISDDEGTVWLSTLESERRGGVDSNHIESFQIANAGVINHGALYDFVIKGLEIIDTGELMIGVGTIQYMLPFLFKHLPSAADAFKFAVNHVDYGLWYHLRLGNAYPSHGGMISSEENVVDEVKFLYHSHDVLMLNFERRMYARSDDWATELGLGDKVATVGAIARAADYYLYKAPDWIKLSDLCQIGDDLMSHFPDDYRRHLCEYLLENRHMGGQAGDRFTYMDHMRSGWIREETMGYGFFRSRNEPKYTFDDDFIRYRGDNDFHIGNTGHTITITPDMVKAIELSGLRHKG